MQINLKDYTPQSSSGFIVFDGVNGAGKSTQLRNLSNYLQQKNIDHHATREPGSTEIGKTIRKLVLDPGDANIAPLTEAFLFAADRAQHVNEVIKPLLNNKTAVICDRYYYSTLAFQAYGRQLPLEDLKVLNSLAIQDTLPDLVFIFDMAPEEGLKRTQKRDSEEFDTFEHVDLDFHTRLRKGFLSLSISLPENFVILNASESEEKVWAQIKSFVDVWINSLQG